MSIEKFEDIFKIIVLGASGVGKTTLLEHFADKVFEEHRTAKTGVNFFTKQINVNGKEYKLQFWEFIEDKQFEDFHQAYSSGASAVLFVFDLTKQETFKFHKKCLRNIWWQINLNRAPLLLIGNKLDLVKNKKLIERKKYNEFVINEGLLGYIETSIKNFDELEKLTPKLVQQIIHLKSFYGKQRPRNLRTKEQKNTILGKEADIRLEELWERKTYSDPEEIQKLISAWEKIVKEKPDYRDGHLQLALLYYKIFEDEKAKEYLQKAIELDPNCEVGRKLKEIMSNL